MMRPISMAVAAAAIFVAIITQRLPDLIERAVTLSAGDDRPGLRRLQIGHAMAGGGRAGAEVMADAILTTLWSKVFGVQDTRSRLAWRGLTDALAAAEDRYLSPSWGFGLGPDTFAAIEIAEGLRYVAHVTRLALDVYLEESPRFVRMVSPTLKLLGDNPDAVYHMANLRLDGGIGGGGEFVVEGCRGKEEVYFSLSVHAPSLTGGAFERVIRDVNDETIAFDSDGCYRLHLSPRKPDEAVLEGSTWLETPREASSLVTRHYFRSWPPAAIHQEVNLSIWYTGEEKSLVPKPISDEAMAHRIDLATDFIRRHTILMPQPDPTTAPPFFSLEPNQIGIPQKWSDADTDGMGAVDIAYAAGRFRLEEGEALILEGSVPRCRFANVVLWNRYLQTLDYTAYDTHPVYHTLHVPGEESKDPAPFSLVLSKTRPESASAAQYEWIFTEGRPMGTVFFRFLLPEGDGHEYEKIRAIVVPVAQVEQYFEGKTTAK